MEKKEIGIKLYWTCFENNMDKNDIHATIVKTMTLSIQ